MNKHCQILENANVIDRFIDAEVEQKCDVYYFFLVENLEENQT